jgi:hypothetical protein
MKLIADLNIEGSETKEVVQPKEEVNIEEKEDDTLYASITVKKQPRRPKCKKMLEMINNDFMEPELRLILEKNKKQSNIPFINEYNQVMDVAAL